MSDTPINLNKLRKARVLAEKRAQADENAVKFGRTRKERDRDAAKVASLRAKIDAHKRDK